MKLDFCMLRNKILIRSYIIFIWNLEILGVTAGPIWIIQ